MCGCIRECVRVYRKLKDKAVLKILFTRTFTTEFIVTKNDLDSQNENIYAFLPSIIEFVYTYSIKLQRFWCQEMFKHCFCFSIGTDFLKNIKRLKNGRQRMIDLENLVDGAKSHIPKSVNVCSVILGICDQVWSSNKSMSQLELTQKNIKIWLFFMLIWHVMKIEFSERNYRNYQKGLFNHLDCDFFHATAIQIIKNKTFKKQKVFEPLNKL